VLLLVSALSAACPALRGLQLWGNELHAVQAALAGTEAEALDAVDALAGDGYMLIHTVRAFEAVGFQCVRLVSVVSVACPPA
jgi:hypothetical protein